jgi:uncharacterized protein
MTTPTLASTNREIVAAIMNELAKGDPRPFADAMSEDFVWRPMGASQLGKWQTRYAGKDEVIHGFFRPLRSQFADTFTNTPRHIYSDGDMVIVESQGRVTMKSGGVYRNDYCMVISMAGGKFKEVREYFDSAMSDAMFDPIRR